MNNVTFIGKCVELNNSYIDKITDNGAILGGQGKSSGNLLEQGKPINTINVRTINLIL